MPSPRRARRRLTSKLSPEGRTRLAAALAKNKMPPGALDRFKPFFASVTLASLQFGSMGMGAEQGAEAVIKRAVKGSDQAAWRGRDRSTSNSR